MNDSVKLQTEMESIGHDEKVGKTLIHFFTHKNNKNSYIALASGQFFVIEFCKPRNETSQMWLRISGITDTQKV